MTQRHSQRLRLAAVLVPVIVLALASFWVLEVMRRSAVDPGPARQREDPDLFVEQFNYVKLTHSGDAQYHISGARLIHNPQDDSYEVDDPFVRTVRGREEPMTITAKRAWINSDSSEVHLFDDVHLTRPATRDREQMQLRTEHLIVLPDEDAMKTGRPVRIDYGKSVLNGVGMLANNATREFRLHGKVHGTYQPPAR
jgi:lipopolysaccharide export system protein LptC